ncbi:hypothetical protein L2E82_16471 [Cichorium intybus]|uniref:Uncharacterized protein n=1 Tax=Cichorium intybus TaxID=13427 RepID=A0ACB9F5N2_CICIN|nr:hypothetical protein L2E82_16471 [Cichorium intybus]
MNFSHLRPMMPRLLLTCCPNSYLPSLERTLASLFLFYPAIRMLLNVVGEAVEEAEVKVDEVVVQDYIQVLSEVGYEENEINVAVQHTEVVHEEDVDEHVRISMSMNIEDSQDAHLIDDTQELTPKPKLLLKLVFKALKKLLMVLNTSIKKMIRKLQKSKSNGSVQWWRVAGILLVNVEERIRCRITGLGSKMKYGLNLRVQSSQQKKQPAKPPHASALGFGDDDDDIEREISRQASKNKALKDEQHKKALEEDPSVFDYDGVYDEMKEKAVRPVVLDKQERKPRYIQALIDKAKVHEREHEIIYERKLAKERSTEDHLFADKDKFVTGAYKKKLAEQAKWLEEERLHQLRKEKEDITKKGGDMTEFYFNLSKNVAFGTEGDSKKPAKQREESKIDMSEPKVDSVSPKEENREERCESVEAKVVGKQQVYDAFMKQEESGKEDVAPATDHHKRNQDALAAAKEKFLARKKTKVNVD